MQIVEREKFYRDNREFVIIVIKDADNEFRSEIYEVKGTINGVSDSSKEGVLVKSKKEIEAATIVRW